MMKSENVIEIRNLSKAYKVFNKRIDAAKEILLPFKKTYHKKFWALKNISFEVKKGEVLGIVGRNGSGKSTLLKVISGVIQPTSGEMVCGGNIGAILELSAGFNPELSGRENIDFYLSLIEYPKKQREKIKKEIIDFSELGDFIERPIKTYSSGMKSKFAFSVNTIIEPEILILDEVLSVGDDMYKRKSFTKMESIIKSGKTVLFVTHNLKSVREVCKRAILLDQGEVLYQGETEKVIGLYQMLTFTTSKKAYASKRAAIKLAFENGKIDSFFNSESSSVTFLEGFKSKAFHVQRNYDVDLENVRICDVSGNIVNVLKTGDRYKIKFKALFKDSFSDLKLRMNIKSATSISISAAESDSQSVYKKVENGDFFEVEWEFKCFLLQGDYFGNLAILGNKNRPGELLIRMVDVLAFKVSSNETHKKDLVTLEQKIRILK